MMCANTPENTFVSFFYGVIDTERKRLTSCNAGHHPPILVRRDGRTKRLICGGGVLGVLADWRYEEDALELEPGDQLLMYTDGISESVNAGGEEFGERRLVELVLGTEGAGPTELTASVVRRVGDCNGGDFEDD